MPGLLSGSGIFVERGELPNADHFGLHPIQTPTPHLRDEPGTASSAGRHSHAHKSGDDDDDNRQDRPDSPAQ